MIVTHNSQFAYQRNTYHFAFNRQPVYTNTMLTPQYLSVHTFIRHLSYVSTLSFVSHLSFDTSVINRLTVMFQHYLSVNNSYVSTPTVIFRFTVILRHITYLSTMPVILRLQQLSFGSQNPKHTT